MRRLGCLIIIPLIIFRCVDPTVNGGEGNGSETIARGVIVDSTGTAAANVSVQLYPVDYNPVLNRELSGRWKAICDDKGEYRISEISGGVYNLEAVSGSGEVKAFIKNIKISGERTEVAVDTGRLQKTGTVMVKLNGIHPHRGDYLYIPGTSVYSVIGENDSISGQSGLNEVPAVKLTDLIYVSAADSINTDLLKDTLNVIPGDTAFSEYAAWKYSRRIFLNTTVTGANIKNNIYNFPALIRLNQSTFDFSLAGKSGEDLLFTKSNGKPLYYEIERWDSEAGKAEIWVRVDTIYGNRNNQSIILYWGNNDADNGSDGNAVFDTSWGFQGVWHMGNEPDDSVYDATVNKYHGISPDTARPLISEGVMGNCRLFDGIADFITMPNTASGKLDFPQNGTYSVSAWVKADTLTDLQQTLVSKGRFQYFLWIDSVFWSFWEFQDRRGWETSEQQAIVGKWVLLTGVRSGSRQYLYVDGNLVDSVTSLTPNTNTRETKSDLNIGRAHELETASKAYSDLCYFKGRIDEVRIYSRALSAEWIKLCFMNQRVDDRLIRFK